MSPFEAVFFWEIDKIAETYPELVDKFLYVGVTRAARYLAATCSGDFPDQLRCIVDSFSAGTWAPN